MPRPNTASLRRRSTYSTPRIRYMKPTTDKAKPMPLGIDEIPMIKIVKGIQNHTVAIAAPVSNEAVGTTPMLRTGAADGPSTPWGAGAASGIVSVTATMPLTYGPQAPCDTAFSRERGGGKPPRQYRRPMATTERHRLLSYLGPNWFASVMGTGIVATAGATLPLHVPG